MTLFKQMGMAISFIIVTILAAVMLINYQTTREDMIQNVYESSVNNIATLSNNLSQTQGDKAFVETTIDAAFDSGFYKSIEFRSSDGAFAYKQEDNKKIESVPSWFVGFADIRIEPLEESVVVGWETIGSVKLLGDVTIVYKSLYKTFVKLLYLFVIFTFVSLLLLSLLLSYILRPLKEIQNQAEAILRDEFVFQEKIPYTTEFREVVRGMNLMVKKVEYIFIKGSETLKRNQELLYVDQTTGLYNRRYLLLKLPDLIALENRANGGSVFFMALKGGEFLNQHFGREATDKLFGSLGEIFLTQCEEFEEGIAVRMNGTEFTLVLPDCEASQSLDIAQNIHARYKALLEKKGMQGEGVTLDIGIYRYRPSLNISELLIRADNALAHAKADETSSIYIYEEKSDENAMGKEQWREIIEESIEKREVELKFWPTLDSRTKTLEHNVMTFTIDDKVNKHYFYGDFIAPAINLGLVSKIYMVALESLLTNKDNIQMDMLCSVRLSSEFMKDPYSFEMLADLFKEHSKTVVLKLAFEMSDNFVVRNPMLVRRFVELFKLYGYGFGINAFTGEADSFEYLKVFNPSFIKADVSFLLDQSKDSMNGLHIITDSLGIRLIATSVRTQEELGALLALDVSRVQGPITDFLTN